MSVTMKREMREIPSYIPGEPNELPFFLEKKPYQGATGRVYPLPFADKLSNERVMKKYDMVTLSNEYIEVELLPELGGKIHGATQKSNGYEFIYKNTCIKPAMVGLNGAWVSGGVEFNWPQHHRPTTFMPTEATLRENPDGSKTCFMGEAEPFHRMRAAVGITVYPGSSLVEATAVVHNRTDLPLPFMWWNNLAVRVHKDYKATFPPDVAWGNDHDRRAVISFPVMKGVYETARPFDYGEGTDATWYSNIKLPTSVMVMRGQSDMDFLGGYDFAADAGTVTVSDHHYSVGKKMWTWGDGDFGHAWCANLTDNGDRYIELMTGVFTDNQPDFTYIMPGEVKTFRTVWYPVREIGEVSNAGREAAVSLHRRGTELRIGVITTSRRENALLRVYAAGACLLEEICSPDPDHAVVRTLTVPADIRDTALKAELVSAEGETLIAYQPVDISAKPAPKARPVPPSPRDVESLEELYLHGAHLEQYKHHTYVPEDYYLEALRRDENDLRSNHAMGRLMLEKGDFAAAEAYLQKAIARLKMRNDNPADTEAIYHLARLYLLTGRENDAYDTFAAASWQMAWRSPCYFEMARIDVRRGDRRKAIGHLEAALETNTRHFAAKTLLGYLTGDRSLPEAVLKQSPQDTFARYALWLMGGELPDAFILNRPEDVLDAALDFLAAGLRDEALRILATFQGSNQLLAFYRAFITGEKPETADMTLCFPNRLDDIAVLSAFPEDWRANYLLGCLYYDRMNYEAARAAWEKSSRQNPSYAFTHRNLAQALFDHFASPAAAQSQLETALALAPGNARILYELLQLYKNRGMSVDDRLAFLENHREIVGKRDDCFLDYIVLHIQKGHFEEARTLLLSKRFNIYEGGEGKLTRMHGWLYTMWGRAAEAAGNHAEAEKWYAEALTYPANYGEGRHYSAQEAQIYYYTGLLYDKLGDHEKAAAAWQNAVGMPDQSTEISYFAALAARRLGDEAFAEKTLCRMIKAGENKLQSAGQYGYFGVGLAVPLPFELDPAPQNTFEGHLLIALGRRGLGEEEAAAKALAAARAADPHNYKLSFLERLGVIG